MESVEFRWDSKDFYNLIESCDQDTATPYLLKYLPKKGVVLEAGCGLGRYVYFLSQRDFEIIGIEINQETVDKVKAIANHLDIRSGDISKLDFEDNSISGIICLGVIEHFIAGPDKPLRELYRVLKPGGYAVITVPSFNLIRKMKYYLGPFIKGVNLIKIAKQSNRIRRFFGRKPIKRRVTGKFTIHAGKVPYKYRNLSKSEDFFEYIFSKQEFHEEINKVGFRIVESVPIALMDGVYHEISRRIVPFRDCTFYPNSLAIVLNVVLSKFPFFHNHMHLCVCKK